MRDDGIKVLIVWCHFTPDGGDCSAVAEVWKSGQADIYRGTYFPSILQLMLAGFCLLITCSQALGQFTVSVEPSFTVTVEPVASTQRQWFLVSEPWCTHCPAAKATFISKGWPESNILTLDQCEARFGFRPDRVPFEFGEPLKPTNEVQPTVTPSGTTVTAPAQQPAEVSMSHSEMVALHNRLHGGGSWTWPGDLASHLQTTHGVSTVKAATTATRTAVRYQQQSSCPGGRCPVPTQRRRGSFGGWFR